MILVVGSINMDIALKVTEIPRPGETVMSHSVQKSPGGKGANQAVAAGKMGGNVVMLGCVGTDEHGSALLSSLSASGVDIRNIMQTEAAPSSTAYICISSAGENCIVVDSSANRHVSPAYLQKHEDLFRQADYCVLQMEIPVETVRMAVQLCRKHQTKIVLNPSPLTDFDTSLLQDVDYLIPNETEAASLLGKAFDSTEDLDWHQMMKQYNIQNMILTLGSAGCKWYCHDGSSAFFPSQPCTAVDTTGAGDTFLGAFVASIDSKLDIPSAVTIANTAAGIAVTRSGAQCAMPYKEEVLASMAT